MLNIGEIVALTPNFSIQFQAKNPLRSVVRSPIRTDRDPVRYGVTRWNSPFPKGPWVGPLGFADSPNKKEIWKEPSLQCICQQKKIGVAMPFQACCGSCSTSPTCRQRTATQNNDMHCDNHHTTLCQRFFSTELRIFSWRVQGAHLLESIDLVYHQSNQW